MPKRKRGTGLPPTTSNEMAKDPVFYCVLCRKSYRSKKAFDGHLRVHKLMCPVLECGGKRFKSHRAVCGHMKTHSNLYRSEDASRWVMPNFDSSDSDSEEGGGEEEEESSADEIDDNYDSEDSMLSDSSSIELDQRTRLFYANPSPELKAKFQKIDEERAKGVLINGVKVKLESSSKYCRLLERRRQESDSSENGEGIEDTEDDEIGDNSDDGSSFVDNQSANTEDEQQVAKYFQSSRQKKELEIKVENAYRTLVWTEFFSNKKSPELSSTDEEDPQPSTSTGIGRRKRKRSSSDSDKSPATKRKRPLKVLSSSESD